MWVLLPLASVKFSIKWLIGLQNMEHDNNHVSTIGPYYYNVSPWHGTIYPYHMNSHHGLDEMTQFHKLMIRLCQCTFSLCYRLPQENYVTVCRYNLTCGIAPDINHSILIENKLILCDYYITQINHEMKCLMVNKVL